VEPKPDLFYLTKLDRFSVLPRPYIHVQGHPETLQPVTRLVDPWATARKHPDLPIIEQAAYAAELIRYRVDQALKLTNVACRTAEEEKRIHEIRKVLAAVFGALSERNLFRRLAPEDDAWSDDAKPAALVDMWMTALPQIKELVAKEKGKKKPDAVRAVVGQCEFTPWPRIAVEHTHLGTRRDALSVDKVLADDHALRAIVDYCSGHFDSKAKKKVTLRVAALRVAAKILHSTEDAVRKARTRYRTRPRKTPQ
jgi:hypothetical protein